MKKRLLLIVLLLVVLLSLTGCKQKSEFKLTIRESSWSGWSKDYEPEETTNEYEVVLNRKYNVDSGRLQFVIEEINEDNIVIRTTDAFSDNEKGVDLRTDKKVFKIYLDEEKKLQTPTMDAGNIYYFTLTK